MRLDSYWTSPEPHDVVVSALMTKLRGVYVGEDPEQARTELRSAGIRCSAPDGDAPPNLQAVRCSGGPTSGTDVPFLKFIMLVDESNKIVGLNLN